MKQYSCAQNSVTTVPVSYSWQILNQNLDEEETEEVSSFMKLQLMKNITLPKSDFNKCTESYRELIHLHLSQLTYVYIILIFKIYYTLHAIKSIFSKIVF